MGLFNHVHQVRGMGSRAPSYREMHEAHKAAVEWEKEARKGRDAKVKYQGSKEEKGHRARGKGLFG